MRESEHASMRESISNTDVHPLGLRLDEEAKYASSVVIYNGEEVKVTFGSGN